MTRDDIKKIIKEEGLRGYNFFEDRMDMENEIVIVNDSNQWIVYVTDERASKITGSEKMFDNEIDALDNFLKRLRALNILRK
ncbi:MAG: Imm59 family immunity protein [Eubacterium sp.]|mgnify:FL=1|uniref:Imm59 family immunity protein n=1 Tax=Eubacterium sp. TaxID=142586 RepID=UPI00262377FB|nr:Imm59 family immunity protein [uncultured Eubacterium sp.]